MHNGIFWSMRTWPLIVVLITWLEIEPLFIRKEKLGDGPSNRHLKSYFHRTPQDLVRAWAFAGNACRLSACWHAEEIENKRRSAIGSFGLLSWYLQIPKNLQVEPQVHATGIDLEHGRQGNGKGEESGKGKAGLAQATTRSKSVRKPVYPRLPLRQQPFARSFWKNLVHT